MPILSIEVLHRRPAQAEYPHVVKFSGGRSSALAALALAENGTPDPERSDLVLFTNTSAALHREGEQCVRKQVC